MDTRKARRIVWVTIGLWAAAILALIPLAGRTGEIESSDPVNELPRAAEATRALERERAAFPDANTPVAVIVYVRASGITAADLSTVESDRVALAALSVANQVGPPISSHDGQALVLSFPIAGEGPQAQAIVGQIRELLADSPPGLETAVTGSAGAMADASEAFGGVESTLLLAAAGVVALLLLLTYRSPYLWLVPLVVVGLASQLAIGVVYLLGSQAGVLVTEASLGIMVVIVFGAGTDYALLLVARYREELRLTASRYTAMARAWRRSVRAIVGSAATAVVGLLCLLAAQANNIRSFGPVAAAGVIVACAVMTTLLPAVLVLLGRWVFWPFVPRYGSATSAEAATHHRAWSRLAHAIGRRPRAVWVGAAVVLVGLSLGVLGLRFERPEAMYTTDVGSVAGQRLIEQHYPTESSNPARIIAAAPSADRVTQAAAAVDGIAAVTHSGTSADGRWVRLSAVIEDSAESAAAKATVDRLRDAVHRVPDADALVGGETAIFVDFDRASRQDNLVLMPVILIVVLGVLVLLLRALVAPVLLTLSVALSFAAAWGVAALVLRLVGHATVDPGIALWSFLFLVTLGVDYTIFLMTRAREEVSRLGNRAGVLTALTVTGGVITSAGVVLAATFATLVVLPVVTALHIGLVVAVGVLLDTLIVRTLLVPAIAVDIGQRVWWPARPARAPTQPRTERLRATVRV